MPEGAPAGNGAVDFATVLGPALERRNPATVDRRHLPPKKQCFFHLHSHGYLRR